MSKKIQVPTYEELFKLSNIDNLSIESLAKRYNTTTTTIKKWKKLLNIPRKSIENSVLCNKATVRSRYGVDCVSQVKSIRDKQKDTCIKKYGCESPLSNSDCIEKGNATKIAKYGTINFQSNEQVKRKREETCLKNNGYTNPFRSSDRQKEWCDTRELKTGYRYSGNNPLCVDKMKKTLLSKYGVDNYFKLEDFKESNRVYWNDNYGIDSPSQINYSDFTKKVLFDCDSFKSFINSEDNKNPKYLADKLGIDILTIHKYAKKYGCEELFEYNVSSYENDIKDLFKGIFYHSRSVIKPYEVDLFNSEHKFGIEFNGNYWHSEIYKDKDYHKIKSDLAIKNNIFLYHIFEYEWTDKVKKDIIISQINNFLGNTSKIFARKCEIREVSYTDSNTFLNENHLQGGDNSKVRLGLYYNNELVSLMTFGKPRFNKNFEWELFRFCNKKYTSVVGGASKLFKYFVNTYKPKSMLSYSNVAKTTGSLYNILGFTNSGTSKPNYVWVKRGVVLTRYQCQKHKLVKQGFDSSKSEDCIMHSRGFVKLYDCGNILWKQYFK